MSPEEFPHREGWAVGLFLKMAGCLQVLGGRQPRETSPIGPKTVMFRTKKQNTLSLTDGLLSCAPIPPNVADNWKIGIQAPRFELPADGVCQSGRQKDRKNISPTKTLRNPSGNSARSSRTTSQSFQLLLTIARKKQTGGISNSNPRTLPEPFGTLLRSLPMKNKIKTKSLECIRLLFFKRRSRL